MMQNFCIYVYIPPRALDQQTIFQYTNDNINKNIEYMEWAK